MTGLFSAQALAPAALAAGGVALLLLAISIWLVLDQRRLRMALAEAETRHDALAASVQETGRIRAEAEAASEAKSRFLATVSHEIRTPLNGVLGMADLMLDTGLSPEQTSYARAIKTSGEALLTLIEEILDFSRIEAGKLELADEAVDLVAVTESIVELLAPRAQGKGIEIAARISREVPPLIRTDGARLRQIVTNLAGNAVKFTETGGVGIAVSAPDAGQLEIRVEDTGSGIPAGRLEAIFGEFEQADTHQRRRQSGTGLGLAISRRLARLMGGDIAVESALGRGSTFTLSLPLRTETASPAAPSPPAEAGTALVVSPGPYEAPFIGAALADLGFAVETCRDVDHAIAALARLQPALVIVDAALGFESSRRIVAVGQENGCRRHLVLLSPFERRSFGAPAAAGFDRYLVKPVRHRSLVAQLADWHPAGQAESAPASEARRLEVAPLAEKRVLIAEDNDINALLAGRLIERLGGRSVRASNGLEALNLLRSTLQAGGQPFDCLLLDIRMPELDGLAAIAEWRAIERAQGSAPTPAIALTANAFREDREACLAAGFDAFLQKPLDRDAFLATLAGLIGSDRRAA